MHARRLGAVKIGISGWLYPPWRGAFYPKRLPVSQELAYAARHFGAIELNGSFYRLQRPEHYLKWRDDTPPGFVFAIKGSRYITHMLKLANARVALANFLASGVLRLGPKLGPILWQFPPQMRFDAKRFKSFLEMLPRDTSEARSLARRHDARVAGRCYLAVDYPQQLRHAIEIRHESFCCAQFLDLLRRNQVALVCADTVDWPLVMDLTADFVYCRLHGSQKLYVSRYSPKQLRIWATRVRAWRRGAEPRDALRIGERTAPSATGRDVFVFFDNTDKLSAPANALALAADLKVRPAAPAAG